MSIIDAVTGERIRKLTKHNAIVNSVCVMRESPWLFMSGADDGSMYVWDSRSKEPEIALSQRYAVTSVALSADGTRGYAGSIDNDVTAWDLKKREISYKLAGHRDTITSVRLSPDGNSLLSNSMDNCGRFIDIWWI